MERWFSTGLKVIVVLLLTAFFLGPNSLIQAAAEPTLCPGQRAGTQTESKLGEKDGALVEEDTCSGNLLGAITCLFGDFLWGIFGTGDRGGTANFSNSSMPYYLRFANQVLLSENLEITGNFDKKREEPGGITGSLPKLFSPTGYDLGGTDALKTLYNSEGALVSGTVILNQEEKQFGFSNNDVADTPGGEPETGFYESADGSYEVPARFGEVSALDDRFGVLRQALFPPSGEELDILNKDCPTYDSAGNLRYDPTAIDVTYGPDNTLLTNDDDPEWETRWTASRPIEDVGSAGCNPDNPESCQVSATGGTGGDLDTKSKVARATQAWERIGAPSNGVAGAGGVYNILLAPGQDFPTFDAEAGLNYQYDPANQGGSSGTAPLFIADLGNVEGALDCIINGVTAIPSLADPTACENAFSGIPPVGGIGGGGGGTGKGACEEFGWPLVSGIVFQGSNTKPPSGTHKSGLQALDIQKGWAEGLPVCSTFNGTVIGASYDEDTYGNWVEIQADNPSGLRIKYGHLQVGYVRAGQKVTVGKVIGKVGHTGMKKWCGYRDCTSNHLHIEFHGAAMQPPQIPLPIPESCQGEAACNASW